MQPGINGSQEGPVSYLVTTTPSTPRMMSFRHREARHPNHHVVNWCSFTQRQISLTDLHQETEARVQKDHLFTRKMFGRTQICNSTEKSNQRHRRTDCDSAVLETKCAVVSYFPRTDCIVFANADHCYCSKQLCKWWI